MGVIAITLFAFVVWARVLGPLAALPDRLDRAAAGDFNLSLEPSGGGFARGIIERFNALLRAVASRMR